MRSSSVCVRSLAGSGARHLELEEASHEIAAADRLPKLRIVAGSVHGQGRSNELPNFSADVRVDAPGVGATDVWLSASYQGQEPRTTQHGVEIAAGGVARLQVTVPQEWADEGRRFEVLLPGVVIRAYDTATGAEASITI